MKKINLDEIIHANAGYIGHDFYVEQVKKAMIEFGKQLLKLAAENATLSYADGRYCLPDYAVENFNAVVDDLDNAYFIDKQSILDTINQIEMY